MNNSNSLWEKSKSIARSMCKLNKKEDGASAIEFVIGSMIFILLLAMFLDLLVLSWKFTVVSQTTSTVARIVGLQGGTLGAAPDGFPSSDYMSTFALKKHIQEVYEGAGIPENDWEITVNDIPLGSHSKIDYRSPVVVKTKVNYKWSFISSFLLVGEMKNTLHSKRITVSEFKYRYDDWEGE